MMDLFEKAVNNYLAYPIAFVVTWPFIIILELLGQQENADALKAQVESYRN